MEGGNILVTGGAGFIGSHIATAFAETCDVSILDVELTNPGNEITVIQGDVRNEETVDRVMADVDVVFHQAALVSVAESVANPTASHAINVSGTLHVLEAARKHDARVVLASSAAVYGHPNETPIPERHKCEPTSPYGLDKLAVDRYARLYNELYGLETVALRYFNVYGPGQTGGDYAGVIKVFLDQARNNEPLTVHGDGSQTRDFVYVDDVVQANRRAAVTDNVGQAFNIGTGTAVTINQLAELISELTDHEAGIRHVEPRDGDIQYSCADITNARNALDYQPQTDLETGLQALLESRNDA